MDGPRRILKFKEARDRLQQNQTNNLQCRTQNCKDKESKHPRSRDDAGSETEQEIPDESGDHKSKLYSWKNVIQDDEIICSDSYLYCKPSTSIGKRKVLKKESLKKAFPKDGGGLNAPIVAKPSTNSLEESTSGECSKVSILKESAKERPIENVTEVSLNKEYHASSAASIQQEKQRTVRFNTCSNPNPPKADGVMTSNAESIQLKSCLKHLPLETQDNPQKNQTYLLPQVQAHQILTGPVFGQSVRYLPCERLYETSCLSTDVATLKRAAGFPQNFAAAGQYILIPKENFPDTQAGRLLAVIPEEDNDVMHSTLQKGLKNKYAPSKDDYNRNCSRCRKPVYLAERRLAVGQVFHSSCFTCFVCGTCLDASTLQEKNSEIYCKFCFMQ